MKFLCECSKCGSRWWCRGIDEPDVNAIMLTGEQQACLECGSDDFVIIDTEYDEP